MTTVLFEKLIHEAESETLDFKQEQYRFSGQSDYEKSELLKDILAFSNAERQTDAHILIGVEEIKGGRGVVHGVNTHLEDNNLQQFVCYKTNRPPKFSYSVFEINGLSCGVIEIPVQKRPLYLLNDFGKLRANAVYVRRGSSTAEARPDEVTEMKSAERETAKPILEIIIEPRIVPHLTYKNLEVPMWINNKGSATADDVVVVIHKMPVGVFGVGYETCRQTISGHSGTALKLINPLNPGDHAFLCSINLGQVEGGAVAAFSPIEFGVRIFARNQAAFNASTNFTKDELFAGKAKIAERQ